MMIAIIILVSLLLFKNSFSIYFFQDDWFLLGISKIKSLNDFLQFFLPHSDVQFYRPLSHEIFYFIGRNLFDLHPLGFHVVAWIFFIFNVILVWKIVRKFIKSKFLQLFFVFLYATSAIHYNSLYWIANFSYILVAFWYFLGFYLFINSRNSRKLSLAIAAIFLLGLLSNEFMITLSVLLFLYILFFEKNKYSFSQTLLLFAIAFFYLFFRFILFKPNYGTYQFIFDKSVFSSYRFFVMFFLNWPETMKDQMINLYKVNPEFLQVFPREFYVFLINSVIFGLAFFLLPVINICSNTKFRIKIFKDLRKIIFALLWFIVNLLPIVFIPSHISPHQGAISFFGFLLLFFVIFDDMILYLNKYVYIPVILCAGIFWMFSSFTVVNLDDRIHWIKRRSDLSKEWVNKIKFVYPVLPRNSILPIPTNDKEVKVALGEGQAFGEIYQTDSIKVIFRAVP